MGTEPQAESHLAKLGDGGEQGDGERDLLSRVGVEGLRRKCRERKPEAGGMAGWPPGAATVSQAVGATEGC